MKKMIFNTDAEYEEFEQKCLACNYKTDWFPQMEDIEPFIRQEPKKYVPFILWLVNQKRELTEEQKKVRKELNKILYQVIEIKGGDEL